MINNNLFKYYLSNDNDRPSWMKYVDDLCMCGRLYINRPLGAPEYTQLTKKEISKLIGLLIIDIPDSDKFDCTFDDPSIIADLFSKYLVNESQLNLYKLINFMVKNSVDKYIDYVESIFEQIREINECNRRERDVYIHQGFCYSQ